MARTYSTIGYRHGGLIVSDEDRRQTRTARGNPNFDNSCCSTSAMWFELCTYIDVLHGIVAGKDEDHGDVGLTISSNGQEYPLQSVFSSQRTEARGEPFWCPCQ